MWRIKINYILMGETYHVGQPWVKRGTVDKIFVLWNFKCLTKQLVLIHWDGNTNFAQ